LRHIRLHDLGCSQERRLARSRRRASTRRRTSGHESRPSRSKASWGPWPVIHTRLRFRDPWAERSAETNKSWGMRRAEAEAKRAARSVHYGRASSASDDAAARAPWAGVTHRSTAWMPQAAAGPSPSPGPGFAAPPARRPARPGAMEQSGSVPRPWLMPAKRLSPARPRAVRAGCLRAFGSPPVREPAACARPAAGPGEPAPDAYPRSPPAQHPKAIRPRPRARPMPPWPCRFRRPSKGLLAARREAAQARCLLIKHRAR